MCLPYRQLDAKSRRIYAAGNLCLFTGIALTMLADGFGHRHTVIYNSLRFLLMGLAIVFFYRSKHRNDGCAARS